ALHNFTLLFSGFIFLEPIGTGSTSAVTWMGREGGNGLSPDCCRSLLTIAGVGFLAGGALTIGAGTGTSLLLLIGHQEAPSIEQNGLAPAKDVPNVNPHRSAAPRVTNRFSHDGIYDVGSTRPVALGGAAPSYTRREAPSGLKESSSHATEDTCDLREIISAF
ncbi:unnamed protein product, partial [Cladocopium goreaui]